MEKAFRNAKVWIKLKDLIFQTFASHLREQFLVIVLYPLFNCRCFQIYFPHILISAYEFMLLLHWKTWMCIDLAPTKVCKSVTMYLTSHEGPQLWINIIHCARITHFYSKSIEESRSMVTQTERQLWTYL